MLQYSFNSEIYGIFDFNALMTDNDHLKKLFTLLSVYSASTARQTTGMLTFIKKCQFYFHV